jgi:hypothetical protein
MSIFSLSTFVLLAVFAQAQAADPAQNLYTQALTHYQARHDLNEVTQAITVLTEATSVVVDPELKYDILVLHARSLYFKGVRTSEDSEKAKLFEAAELKANEAKLVDDQYAEAYYVAALGIARWAEVKGPIASLRRKGELLDNLEAAKVRISRTLEAGETIDGYGPNRVMGRTFYKLPAFAGGSRDRSLQLLKVCFERNANYPINVLYYAETLAAGSRAEVEQAKKILDELLAKDPQTINTSRIPENEDEFKLARTLRSQL